VPAGHASPPEHRPQAVPADPPPQATAAADNAQSKADNGTATCQSPVASSRLAADSPVKTVDVRGQQCPGLILTLKSELQTIAAGSSLTILASDPSFEADVAAWCRTTGNALIDIHKDGGITSATIQRMQCPASAPGPVPAASADATKGKTIVLFSDDFDKAVAAFIIANGAAAMGSDVTIFFTFWGLNVLRRKDGPRVPKTVVERMFGWMMPRGTGRLKLSKMNMMGMGGAMIRGIMRKKNVLSLDALMRQALAAGVKFVACSMSMDLMGIKAPELIDGVRQGGVATYLDTAQHGNVNLFI
jgi:peroxiredoxin family protein/TusA-related sulfurtransferase